MVTDGRGMNSSSQDAEAKVAHPVGFGEAAGVGKDLFAHLSRLLRRNLVVLAPVAADVNVRLTVLLLQNST